MHGLWLLASFNILILQRYLTLRLGEQYHCQVVMFQPVAIYRITSQTQGGSGPQVSCKLQAKPSGGFNIKSHHIISALFFRNIALSYLQPVKKVYNIYYIQRYTIYIKLGIFIKIFTKELVKKTRKTRGFIKIDFFSKCM